MYTTSTASERSFAVFPQIQHERYKTKLVLVFKEQLVLDVSKMSFVTN